jgi:adenylate kinase
MAHIHQSILLVGPPGSGKGTQGAILGRVPGFFHCACGDVFRALDTRTELGKAFIEYSSRGELVPDELTVKLWRVRINQSVETHAFKPDIDLLVLDGIPRNAQQAALLESLLDVRHVFHMDCGDRTRLVARLKKRAIKDNRLDDANEAVIARRLDTYERETFPLLEYYGAERTTRIDATVSPIRVLDAIVSVMIGKGIVRDEL